MFKPVYRTEVNGYLTPQEKLLTSAWIFTGIVT